MVVVGAEGSVPSAELGVGCAAVVVAGTSSGLALLPLALLASSSLCVDICVALEVFGGSTEGRGPLAQADVETGFSVASLSALAGVESAGPSRGSGKRFS